MQFFLFFALILTVVLVLFAVQNSTVITLRFIKWTFDGPIALLLALAFVMGMFTGIFLIIPSWWRKARESRMRKKRIDELEREVLGTDESSTKGT
jgi:uncharacterized integral membrane protein